MTMQTVAKVSRCLHFNFDITLKLDSAVWGSNKLEDYFIVFVKWVQHHNGRGMMVVEESPQVTDSMWKRHLCRDVCHRCLETLNKRRT